ncbi:hypothetical protein KC867_03235 [Candidatus Saccharibacteria bacterium]|nr:hypothetical protein [Candidatus Saccharibacteria bacterium]
MSIFKKSNNKTSSRLQIDIKGVRDGILILPGNQYRAVLELSSINFELKSEAEQDALIETYQSFLNSLSTPLQIIVRVREMDMDKYLDDFKKKRDSEKEKVYKDEITNYTEFVSKLITKNKILSRRFYVVVPLTSRDKNFDIIKEQLSLTIDIVAKGLSRLGMQADILSSLEVLDLFYSFYSPELAKQQPLKDQTLKLLTESYI